MQNLDVNIFYWLNSWAGISPFFDAAIIFRAQYLPYMLVLGLSLFFFATFHSRFLSLRKKHTELVLLAFISGIVARYGFTFLIREWYNRPRPFEVLEGVHQILAHAPGGSFPSGHTSFAFAIAATVSFYYPKTSLLFFAAALSIGLGRVAAGVHWPSDIVGGALVGIIVGWFIPYVWNKKGGRSRL